MTVDGVVVGMVGCIDIDIDIEQRNSKSITSIYYIWISLTGERPQIDKIENLYTIGGNIGFD